MFERILVPLDGSTRAEHALPIAAHIARTTGGTLVLLRAVNIPVGYGTYLMHGLAFIERMSESDLEAKQYLAATAKLDALAGIPIETEVLHGTPALALLDAIPEHHIDSVIICSRGHTGVKRWVLGSVALKIAQYSSVPVLILHEDNVLPPDFYPEARPPLHISGIVVALDGTERALATLEPAAHLAAAMAAPTKGILHLTQMLPLPPNSEVGESIDIYEFTAMTTRAGRSHWPTSSVTEHILSVNQLPLLIVPLQETEMKPEQTKFERTETEGDLVKL